MYFPFFVYVYIYGGVTFGDLLHIHIYSVYYMYVHTYIGKLKSKSEVKREGSQNDSPKFNAEQNFGGLYQNQYNLMITGQHDDHSSLSNGEQTIKSTI